MAAEATTELLSCGEGSGDHDRCGATWADQRAMGDPLDPVPGEPPFLLDVCGPDLAVDANRLVLGWIEMERHW